MFNKYFPLIYHEKLFWEWGKHTNLRTFISLIGADSKTRVITNWWFVKYFITLRSIIYFYICNKHHRVYIYWIFLDKVETSKVSRDISCFEVLCQQDLCCDRRERLSQRGPGNVIKNLQHRIPNIPRELKTIKTFQKQQLSK